MLTPDGGKGVSFRRMFGEYLKLLFGFKAVGARVRSDRPFSTERAIARW